MKLINSLISISAMTLCSRVLGFIRDVLQALYFGAGSDTDAFNVAFKLPNLLRRIFAEGAFSQAFLPIFINYKNTQDTVATKQLFSSVFVCLSIIVVVISLIGILAATSVIYLTAPGFNSQAAILATSLLRITFGYIFFISLASLVGSVLNAYHKFMLAAATPIVLNISFIIFTLLLRQYFHPPILALAWATLCGGSLQLAMQLPQLYKIGLLPSWRDINWQHPALSTIAKLMLPALFAVSVAQISLLINTMYASFLPLGSISWLYYADRLMELPTGVFGVALGTLLLPKLSQYAATQDQQQFSAMLDWGLRCCLIITIPASIGLYILAVPVVSVLFMHGKFMLHDALMTAAALKAYTVGLSALITIKVLAPAFYAHQDIKTPVKIATVALCCTQLSNVICVHLLQHAGLALSISIGAWVNAGGLIYFLLKTRLFIPQPHWSIFTIKLILANVVLILVLLLCRHQVNSALLASWTTQLCALTIVIALATLSYLITLYLLLKA